MGRMHSASAERRGVRPGGLSVMAALVLLGLASGAAYYHWRVPAAQAELEAEIASAPSTAEGLLQRWHEIGSNEIHHRLTQVARFSDQTPWIVTHAVRDIPGGDPMIWGVDTRQLPLRLSHLDGMTVVVDLPAPIPLGHGRLTGDRSAYVPVFAPGEPVPDPRERLRDLARWFLGDLPEALSKDIEGARLEIRVAAR